jgi:hypothetical protein
MPDNMFDTDPVQPTEGKFDLQGVVMSDRKKKKDAVQIAMMRSANSGVATDEAYRSVLAEIDSGVKVDALQQQEQSAYLLEVSRQMNEYVVDNAGTANPEIQSTINSIIGDFTGVRDSYLDQFDGVDQVFADQYADESIDMFRQRQIASKATVFRMMEQQFEDDSFVEDAGNFVAQMLTPDDMKDFGDLAKNLGTDRDGLKEIMAEFQVQDPEAQMAIMEVMMPAIISAFDNNPTAVRSAVEMFYSDDINHDMMVTAIFDSLAAVDVVFVAKGVVSGLAKLGASVARNRGTAKQLKDLENMDMAGAQTAVAGADKTDEALQALDVNRVDVASTAHPASLEDTPLLSGQMDNLSSSVQDANKSVINRLIENLLPDAGNKLSKGEAKKLRAKKQALEYDINKLKERKVSVTKKDVRTGVAKKSVIDERIVALQDELATLNETMAKNVAAAESYADISRLKQGIIPPRMKGVYDAAMQDELAKLSRPIPEMPVEVTPSKAEDVAELAGNPRLLDSPEEFGLTPEFAEFLHATVRAPLREVAEATTEGAIKPLTAQQRATAERNVVEKFKARMEKSGQNVNSLEVSERSEDGFTAKYVTDNGDTGSYTHEFTVSDSGSLVSDPKLAKSNVVAALRGVMSPDVVWREMLGSFISNITYAGQQGAKTANAMSRKWQDIEKGLSKESRIHVDALIQAGDEAGTVFTPKELLEGMVEIKIGKQGFKRKYAKEEVAAYFQKRAFFDELHQFRNEMTRDQLSFMGYKNVGYTDAGGVARNVIVKSYDDVGTAKAQMGKETFFIPDNEGAGVAKFTDNVYVRDKMADQGYQPVKLLEPLRNKDGKTLAEWAMVKTDDVKQLPSQVLNYTAGYRPRIYKPGYFFVKNLDTPHHETLYAFESKDAANAYATKLRDDPTSGYNNVVVKEDREFSDLEKLVNSSDSYGGLYTSHRKASNLMVKGEDGEFRPDTLSTAQATQRYIQSVSNVMPINTYRMAVVEQWMNTVNDIAKLEGRKGINIEDGFEGAIDLSPDSLAEMNSARDYLRRVLNIPSDEESYFRNTMMSIGQTMRGKVGGDFVLNNIHADPVKAMKGLTFNAHLGWFNPRQLWVQAQNAAIALSMHPVSGAKAMVKYPAFRAAVFSDNPDVWKAVAKKSGINAEEFAKDIQMFKDSGLLDAIVRTADFDANVAGIGTGTFQTVRKAAKAGRIPYEEGETASRIMTWLVAKDNLKASGKELTARSLSDETVRMHMNLQAENAAAWQTGALGIPTQFVQVFAKFGENMLPTALGGTGKWTAKEKASVLAGQVALYGTVGVPLAEGLVSHVAELLGTDPVTLQRERPMLLEGVEEGMVGMLFATLGLENNFSEGSSLLAGMDDNVAVELISGLIDYLGGGNGEASVYDVGFGASGNTLKRGGDAITNLFEAARNLYISPSLATLQGEVLDVISGVAATTSTWSNARKAYYAKALGQGLRSKRGTVLLTPDELGTNWASDVAKAFGFPYDRESALWRAYDYNMDSKESVRQTTDSLRQAYLQAQRTGNIDLFRKQKALILEPHSHYVRRQIEKNFNTSTIKGDSMFSRQVKPFTKDMLMNGGREPIPLAAGTLLQEEG